MRELICSYATSYVPLDEIGRRIALGQFKVNVILKGDVDGSVEALSDSFSKYLLKFKLIYIKGVGRLLETDVMLASAQMQSLLDLTFVLQVMQDSFDKERNDIRYYSIIYAVDDLKMQWKNACS
jgi:translation initiation factor IF-2